MENGGWNFVAKTKIEWTRMEKSLCEFQVWTWSETDAEKECDNLGYKFKRHK